METQQRTFEEINQWGQVIPNEKFVALDIYTRCIEAINQHFQYPSFFSALIGYLIFFSTDHWSSAQKAALKNPGLVQCLQEQAESIILLGWNTNNTNPSVGIAQLDTLVKTLATMSHMALVGSPANVEKKSMKSPPTSVPSWRTNGSKSPLSDSK